MTTLKVNGELCQVATDPDASLLAVLRESLGLRSVKLACDARACGACMVHIDGAATRSCSASVADVSRSAIVTLEGLAREGGWSEPHSLQAAWLEHQVPQCAHCHPGMIMAAAALLKRTPHPTDEQIEATIARLCRCDAYPRIRSAVRSLTRD